MSETTVVPSPRPVARVNPPGGPTYGDVVSANHRPTSKVEDGVKDFLREAGFQIAKGPMGVVCHHPEAGRSSLVITPDIVLRDLWLAIEVDPCNANHRGRGFSHAGNEDKDRLRNELLAAVGWTVIRLRLGATQGNHIGDRDVVVESSGFTKAAATALLEAIDDYCEQRSAHVRVVKKGRSPAAPKRRSHVVNIGLDGYSDDTYWFTWYPDLSSSVAYKYRLPGNGRYLYGSTGRGSGFVAEVGLHIVEQTDWKTRLTDYLAGKTPNDLPGTTKWPWGNTLLIPANQHDNDTAVIADLIEASDHEKQTIDRIEFWFTVAGAHVAAWTPQALHRVDQTPLVSIHPDAIAMGYRFANVTSGHGYRGPYQRIAITRAPEQAAGVDAADVAPV